MQSFGIKTFQLSFRSAEVFCLAISSSSSNLARILGDGTSDDASCINPWYLELHEDQATLVIDSNHSSPSAIGDYSSSSPKNLVSHPQFAFENVSVGFGR